MTQNVDRETVVSRLLAADDILILCHKNPDGDTIGSGTALCLALQQLGKNAAVLCSDLADAMGESRHQRITPYTPRHNGKIERYNRILAEEFLYARTWHSEAERTDALQVWNRHYNYHRPHGAHDGQPPASATPSRVNNVLASYS